MERGGWDVEEKEEAENVQLWPNLNMVSRVYRHHAAIHLH